MEDIKRRLFFTGPIGCGKSTAISRALGSRLYRCGGFLTRRRQEGSGKYFSLEKPDGTAGEIFLDVSGSSPTVKPEVFSGFGLSLLCGDAVVLDELENGEIATCVGVSDNGWSKLLYKGTTCYAVTSYLTEVTDASAVPDEGKLEPKPTESIQQEIEIQTQFEFVEDRVTAKKAVNLRSLPSTEDPRCVIVAQLDNGVVIRRTGINRDLGWSRVDYNGQPLYCITSYLKVVE